MKNTTPEIAWHNREPVFSIDIQPRGLSSSSYRLASAGADKHIIIWYIHCDALNLSNEVTKIESVADLTNHSKTVNVVRFSPSSELLASADDDSVVIIWRKKEDNSADFSDLTRDEKFEEQWLCQKILRRHLEDVLDISWSPDSKKLVSCSIDNTITVWDVEAGHAIRFITSHSGYVQGVTWDPLDQFVASLSCDQTCQVFSTTNKQFVSKCYKTILPQSGNNGNNLNKNGDEKQQQVPKKIFHGERIKTFFRRLTFSPDGNLLITPTGFIDDSKGSNAAFVFLRNAFHQPIMYYASGKEHTVAVRCCPVLFKLKGDVKSEMFNFPYRMIIAVATEKSILLYDTQQRPPFAYITDMHYDRLTDLAWSSTGNLLIVSSADGFCTLVTFAENELGEKYIPPTGDAADKQNTV